MLVSFGEVSSEFNRFREERWAIACCLAACTQRLNPQLQKYFVQNTTVEDVHRFRTSQDVLARIWTCVRERSEVELLQVEEQEEFEHLLLAEDVAFAAGHPYAVDAMESIALTSRYLSSEDIREAIATSEHSYNAVDNFVVNNFNYPTKTDEDERLIVAHPIVQKELQRQMRDLRQACAAPRDQFSMVCAVLRDRALQEGRTVFSE